MTSVALTARPTRHGWVVCLTNGQELARFNGLCAKQRAMSYLRGCLQANRFPRRPSWREFWRAEL